MKALTATFRSPSPFSRIDNAFFSFGLFFTLLNFIVCLIGFYTYGTKPSYFTIASSVFAGLSTIFVTLMNVRQKYILRDMERELEMLDRRLHEVKTLEQQLLRPGETLEQNEHSRPEAQRSPPAVAEWLITLFVPSRRAETLLGDFEERFHCHVEARGRRMARALYWAEVLRSISPLVFAKAKKLGLIAVIAEMWRRSHS